ncbi:MAG: Fic family protein [Ktedonobacterales bacterium]
MIDERKALFESLGGLPETTVTNSEWLYMLHEDTRQSLAIEGYVRTEEQLDAALHGAKTDLDISNYYRAASTLYDQALQYYREASVPPLNLAVVRHIHSELFRELDNRRGEFRRGGIRIGRAKVTPPEHDIETYVNAAMTITDAAARAPSVLSALARTHMLFESIHPFNDGNWRTGRILLNYLAIIKGLPPIVIKGMTSEDRDRYYAALEAADSGFHRGFPEPTVAALSKRVEEGNFAPLSQLLLDGLLPRLDRLIAIALERHEPLLELSAVAAQLGITEGALRVRIHRGRHIAIKRGKRLYSHPRLAL